MRRETTTIENGKNGLRGKRGKGKTQRPEKTRLGTRAWLEKVGGTTGMRKYLPVHVHGSLALMKVILRQFVNDIAQFVHNLLQLLGPVSTTPSGNKTASVPANTAVHSALNNLLT